MEKLDLAEMAALVAEYSSTLFVFTCQIVIQMLSHKSKPLLIWDGPAGSYFEVDDDNDVAVYYRWYHVGPNVTL
jgi:hypothetical protein